MLWPMTTVVMETVSPIDVKKIRLASPNPKPGRISGDRKSWSSARPMANRLRPMGQLSGTSSDTARPVAITPTVSELRAANCSCQGSASE
jgi:hypothetical protein